MTSNVKMILDEVNARIKLAEAKTAEDPSNFDSFPGAENDKPVADEKKKPDPEGRGTCFSHRDNWCRAWFRRAFTAGSPIRGR